MGNSLLSLLGGGNAGGAFNIFLKAVGAMMRGESPQVFFQNLANTVPELRGIDASDLNGEAQRLCRERGIDQNRLTEEIKQSINRAK